MKKKKNFPQQKQYSPIQRLYIEDSLQMQAYQNQPSSSSQNQHISDPLIVKSQDLKRKTKYKCQHCQIFMHHSKKQCIHHKKYSCKKRKHITKIRAQNKNKSEFLRRIKVRLDEEKQQQQKINDVLDEEKQLSKLKKNVQDLMCVVYQATNPQALNQNQLKIKQISIVNQIMANIQSTIIGSITINLRQAVQNALNSGLNIAQMKHNISFNLIGKINEIDFNQIIFNFNQKLEEAFAMIQKDDQNKDKKTKDNNQRAFRWISNYRQFHFYNQTILINDLSKQNFHKQANIRRFFRKVQKFSSFFAKMPPIPLIAGQYSWKKTRPVIQLYQIASFVSELINSKNMQSITLAVDIWAVICLGLRSPDFKRVYFNTSQGIIAHSIKIFQKKNRKFSFRYIPQSLAILISLFNISYPITQDRLMKARKTCLQVFRTFYGARHLLILTVLSALSQSSNYTNFHRNIRITRDHYLTGQQSKLIDNSFSLPFQSQNQVKKSIENRNIILDLTGIKPRQLKNQKPKITIDTIQDINIIQIAQRDSILSGEVKIQEIFQSNIKLQEKIQLMQSIFVYNSLNKELVQSQPGTAQIALRQIFQDPQSFDQYLSYQLQISGKSNAQQQVVQESLKMTDSNINVIVCSVQQKKSSLRKHSNLNNSKKSNQNNLYIVKSSETGKFRAVESQKQRINKQYQTRRSKQIARLKNKKICKGVPRLQRNFLKCKKCKHKLKSFINEQTNKNILKCSFCEDEISYVQKTYCFQDYYPCSKMKINLLSPQNILDVSLKSIKPKKNMNNFKQYVQKDFGNSSYNAKQSSFSNDFPDQIQTNYCSFSSSLKKQILFNRKHQDFLGLTIKKSRIPHANLGIFATEEIQPNSIIMTYNAIICTTFSCNLSNNSLFTLGWLNSEQFCCQVFLFPQRQLNCARYINSSDEYHKKNCKTRIGILDNQIVLIIYSISKIQKNQEILYDYGKTYFQTMEVEQGGREEQSENNQ